MMAIDVSMDYAVVQRLADDFRASAGTLRAVGQALEVASALLKTSAFVGMVGNLGLAMYLDNIRPHVERLAATCDELHGDLLGAIASLRDGDYSGSQRFTGGAGPRPAAGAAFAGHARSVTPEDGRLYSSDGTPYAGSGSSVNTVFVNGILTSPESFRGNLGQMNAAWGGANVVGLYNASENAGADIAQAIGDKLQAFGFRRPLNQNPAVESLKALIRQNAAGDRTLELVAHSQGGAIVSAALNDLYREDPSLVSFVKVTTFGTFGTDYPPGPTYHHYIHSMDPVSLVTQFVTPASSPGNMMRFFANVTVLPHDGANPFTSGDLSALIDHDLNSYIKNVDGFRQAENVVAAAPAPLGWFAQAAQIAELFRPL
ncbi:MAG: hypothetical protein KJ047_13485 [Anaerolineae bacterium]|nr:hypothetical protein [Anaerolineae bacterium]